MLRKIKIRRHVLIGCLLNLYANSVLAFDASRLPDESPKPHRFSDEQLPPTLEGCWHVDYPGQGWKRVECTKILSIFNRFKKTNDVGAGVDYSALTTRQTKSATGTFPVSTGVKFATIDGKPGKDQYSLQLNTNFSDATSGGFVMLGNNSPYCSRHNYKACSTWLQFAYLNGLIFIQNWLYIDNSGSCPRGWNDQGPGREYRSCWKNSSGASVPQTPVTELSKVTLKGMVANGLNTIMFTDSGGGITATSQKDDTLEIGATWKQSEFNVFSNTSESTHFNSGAFLTVRLAVDDGTGASPVCIGPAHGGTTAESTNLNLGKCQIFSGSPAGIEFTQSNVRALSH